MCVQQEVRVGACLPSLSCSLPAGADDFTTGPDKNRSFSLLSFELLMLALKCDSPDLELIATVFIFNF